MPQYEDMDWSGLEFSRKQFENATNIDMELWKKEVQLHEKLFVSLQDKLPKELSSIRESTSFNLSRSDKIYVKRIRISFTL